MAVAEPIDCDPDVDASLLSSQVSMRPHAAKRRNVEVPNERRVLSTVPGSDGVIIDG
jgi:hypothetical protein